MGLRIIRLYGHPQIVLFLLKLVEPFRVEWYSQTYKQPFTVNAYPQLYNILLRFGYMFNFYLASIGWVAFKGQSRFHHVCQYVAAPSGFHGIFLNFKTNLENDLCALETDEIY